MVKRGIDTARVQAAIEAAERATAANIVVSIAPWFWGSVEACAHRAFERLAVARTHDHRGVLVFVAPARRRFSLVGDPATHAALGQPVWDAVVASIAERFRARDLTGGVVHGVEAVGAALATHFPHGATATR